MRHRRRVTLFALAVAALAATVLAACVGASQPSYPVTPVEAESNSGSLAPDFPIAVYQGKDVLGGQKVRFSDLFGRGKPLVLNFWAGACPPCRAEMPHFQEMYEIYKDRVFLVGLDVGPFVRLGTREDGQALVKELKITYPTGTTFDPEVVREYKVLGMPTTVFVKPNGEIFSNWTGLLTRDKLIELVEKLLAASGKR